MGAAVQRLENRQQRLLRNKTIQRAMTYDQDNSVFYGSAAPLLDFCDNGDLMSLSLANNYEFFLDLVGWTPVQTNEETRSFITYVAPSGTAAGTNTPGFITNPCGPFPTGEWGKTKLSFTEFGDIGAGSEVIRASKNQQRYCDRDPIKRVDGEPIDNEMEWHMHVATSRLMLDLHQQVIIGDKTTPGSFDGFLQLIDYTATDPSLHSMVFDWKDNPAVPDGSWPALVTPTYNGVAVTGYPSIIHVIREWVRLTLFRIRNTPRLPNRPLPGEMFLVMPDFLIETVLDAYACYRQCGGNWERLDIYEARRFREELESRGFGYGSITAHNIELPIVPYDYGLIDVDGDDDETGTILMLTKSVGGVELFGGEFNDLGHMPQEHMDYEVYDRNMFVTWVNRENDCIQRLVLMQPRITMFGPAYQGKIMNVASGSLFGAYSSDPTSPYFLNAPVTKFVP